MQNNRSNGGDLFRERFGVLQKKLAFLLVGMVLLFITIQFIILGFIGVKGNTVSQIKAQQDEYRIENEILRAKIMDSKVSSKIKKVTEEELSMKPVTVKVINVTSTQATAQR